jgi:hypothetical protein
LSPPAPDAPSESSDHTGARDGPPLARDSRVTSSVRLRSLTLPLAVLLALTSAAEASRARGRQKVGRVQRLRQWKKGLVHRPGILGRARLRGRVRKELDSALGKSRNATSWFVRERIRENHDNYTAGQKAVNLTRNAALVLLAVPTAAAVAALGVSEGAAETAKMIVANPLTSFSLLHVPVGMLAMARGFRLWARRGRLANERLLASFGADDPLPVEMWERVMTKPHLMRYPHMVEAMPELLLRYERSGPADRARLERVYKDWTAWLGILGKDLPTSLASARASGMKGGMVVSARELEIQLAMSELDSPAGARTQRNGRPR